MVLVIVFNNFNFDCLFVYKFSKPERWLCKKAEIQLVYNIYGFIISILVGYSKYRNPIRLIYLDLHFYFIF